MTIVAAIAWIAAGLVAGGLVLVSLGIVRAGRTFDATTWTTVHRALDKTIGPYMRAAVLIVIASSATLAFVNPTYAVSAVLFVVVLAISLRGNIPINREVAAWSAPPMDWHTRRDRWNALQAQRAIAAAGGLVAMLAA